MFVDYLTTVLGDAYKVPGEIEPTRSLEDLGLDSLALAELGAQLEEELSVIVDEEELTTATTVAQLAEMLESRGAVLPA